MLHIYYLNKLNYIYFTMIKKQVLQIIFISLVRTDVNVRGSLLWEEAVAPGIKKIKKILRTNADADYVFVMM